MAGIGDGPEQENNGLQKTDVVEEMIADDLISDGDMDVDESSIVDNTDKAATRRRLENYLEERRLRKELDDDLF